MQLARLLALVSITAARVAVADAVDTQPFPGFGAIVDAQPTIPLRAQFAMRAAVDRDHTELVPSVAVTPGLFGANGHALIGLALPGVSFHDGMTSEVDAMSMFWQQRWVSQHGAWPTIGTVLSAGFEDHEVTASGMLLVVESVDAVALYGSASCDQDGVVGGLVGGKVPVVGPIELGVDTRADTAGTIAFEAAAVVTVAPTLTLSPGIVYTLDEPLSAGMFVVWIL